MIFGWGKKAALPAERKSAELSLAGVLGWLGWGTSAGISVNDASALAVPAVFCAVRTIAEGMAQMPGVVKARSFTPGGLPRLKPLHDHWATKLLTESPNGFQTAHEFVEGMIFNAALGAGGLAIKNVIDGVVVELLPVPSSAWTVRQMPDYALQFRVDYADKTHGYFSRDQVLLVRGPSLDGFSGLPAVRLAREAIGLSVALERQQAKLAGNGGKPSGILSFKKALGPEAKEKLRATWQSKFGVNGEGGIAVLDTDATFGPITMNSVDAEFLETRRMQIEEIGRAFRVQPIMMMQTDKTPFGTAEQMFRMHVVHTLGPWIRRWEDAIRRDILGFKATPQLIWDMDEAELLRGDWEVQGSYFATALGAGGQPAWMTQDEVRVGVGLNPMETEESQKLNPGSMGQMAGAAPGKAASKAVALPAPQTLLDHVTKAMEGEAPDAV